MAIKGRIFVVEDDDFIGAMLSRALKQAGYEVYYETNTENIIAKISSWAPDLTMLDNNLPGMTGLEILAEIQQQQLATAVIMLTADDSVETSVKAMKLGALDYLTKPFNMDEVLLVVARELEKAKLQDEIHYFRKRCQECNLKKIIGDAPVTQDLLAEIQVIAKAGVDTILVTGESGAGKELVASHLHKFLSHGNTTPLIRINCAALPETLLEAELFGYSKGAFTDARQDKKGLFELADGGCLLLDEIAEMKMELQSKLLRVLEDHRIRRIGGQEEIKVDVTIIATTNKDISSLVKQDRFRLDLFYRLNTFHLQVSPLRKRTKDILPLAEHFLGQYNRHYMKDAITGFTDASQKLLLQYARPGNVRELKNVMERLVVLKNPTLIEPQHLPPEISGQRDSENFMKGLDVASLILPPEGLSMEAVEKNFLRQAMAQTDNNQKKAATLLHMKYDTFRYKLKKHGLLM